MKNRLIHSHRSMRKSGTWEFGTILPDLYGHFTEHIGGVVYDGIGVGEDSKIPNINGIRKELVEYMRRLKPPVVRWPGGCFADSYNWRDGIGSRDQPPRRPFLDKPPRFVTHSLPQ